MSTLTDTYDTFRGFGGGSNLVNQPCLLVEDHVHGGRNHSLCFWTHYMIVAVGDDVADGVLRVAGSNVLTYADGDEVRIPSGATTPKWVVVWVEPWETDGTQKKVYLLRDTA